MCKSAAVIALMCITLLGLVFLASVSFTRGARAEEWEKVDCAGSPLQTPPGLNGGCWKGPTGARGTTTCSFMSYSFGGLDGATTPRFHAEYNGTTMRTCDVGKPADPLNAMKRITKFVADNSRNWSALQKGDGDDVFALFDTTEVKRNGKCVGFVKLGPAVRTGVRYTVVGFICKAPGEALDFAAALSLVRSVKVSG
jgi:hypothetical protein